MKDKIINLEAKIAAAKSGDVLVLKLLLSYRALSTTYMQVLIVEVYF